MVYGRGRVHGDEDGAGQVGEDDAESSRRLVRQARANDSKASSLGGRSDTRRHRRFDRFGLKTGESVTSCGGVQESLTSLASKPGETCLIGLSLKTKGGLGAILVRAKDTWRHLEAYVEPRRSREGGLSVRYIFLKYGWFYPCVGGYLN